MLTRSRSLSLPLLGVAMLMLALGPVGCASGKARDHWWQFWRPKKVASAMLGDGSGQPPDPNGTDLAGDSSSIPPEGGLPPIGVLPGTEEQNPMRKSPIGESSDLVVVHFEYNRYDIGPEAREALEHNAAWLKSHSGTEILIEGHCDERGSIEYNLNLGQQRANSVKQFLLERGVPAGVLHTISYGEERPIDQGHSEAAWSKNRRAMFLLY